MSAEPTGFRLDRTVTLSIVFALCVQTAGALIWAGSAAARLETLERRVELTAPISERMARLEEQMLMARESLIRIERQLENPQSRP